MEVLVIGEVERVLRSQCAALDPDSVPLPEAPGMYLTLDRIAKLAEGAFERARTEGRRESPDAYRADGVVDLVRAHATARVAATPAAPSSPVDLDDLAARLDARIAPITAPRGAPRNETKTFIHNLELHHVHAWSPTRETIVKHLAWLCPHDHDLVTLHGHQLQRQPDGTWTWLTPHHAVDPDAA